MLKKFFSAIAAFAILFTACEMPTEEATGKITITSETTFNVGAAGNCLTADYVIEEAVKGMLPKTRLGAAIFKNLKVYAGAEHPHAAQNPKSIKLNEIK